MTRMRRKPTFRWRPLSIDLMRPRVAEIDEHPVAHVFGDKAAEAGNGLGNGAVIGGYDIAQILGIEACGSAEPTRSQNITVSCRRSAAEVGTASLAGAAGAGRSSPRKPAISASSLRRCPTRFTPRSFKSSPVRSDNTATSIALLRPRAFARSSQQTRRWREMDSNLQFRARRAGVLTGLYRRLPSKVVALPPKRPVYCTRDRWFESISLHRRVSELSVPERRSCIMTA
jgi:hypothetical protein